jgi:sugar lactone lactonase YvrE
MTAATASSRRSPWPLLVIIAILGVGVWMFTQRGEPPEDESAAQSDGLTYVQRVTPLVEAAERLAATLETTNSLALKLETRRVYSHLH